MKKLIYLLILWPALAIGQLPINYSMDVKGFVKANAVTLDTNAVAPPYKKGTMFWDNDNGTVSVYLGNGVTWQGGIENLKYVHNVSGTLIGMGKFVYIYASGGETPRVALADNRYIYSSYTTIGITTSDISQGGFGWVCIAGEVHELTTTNEGQKFYLGTSGNITFTRPTNAHVVSGGIVQYAHNVHGILDVRIEQETYPQLEILNNLATDGARLDTTRGITLIGNTTVWEDINFNPLSSGGAAVSLPDYVTINNTVHREFTSANNQSCGDVRELPHDYKLSSNLTPHCHFFLKSGETAGTTGATFTLYWELRQTTGTTSGSVTLSATSAQLIGNAHQLNISGTAFAGAAELGGQLSVTIARTEGNAGDVVLLTYGIHYEKDQMGSSGITTK